VSLTEVLAPLSETPGVEAWVLVGEEGFPLEAFSRSGQRELGALAGVASSVLASARAVAEELGRGPLEEVMVEYDLGPVVLLPVRGGAVLVVLLDAIASLGRVRLALKRLIPELKEALA